MELKIRAVSPPGPEGVDRWGDVEMSGAEMCVKSSGERGTQRMGLSLCPLSQSADLHPCVYRGP